jgi:hypothetical protein
MSEAGLGMMGGGPDTSAFTFLHWSNGSDQQSIEKQLGRSREVMEDEMFLAKAFRTALDLASEDRAVSPQTRLLTA